MKNRILFLAILFGVANQSISAQTVLHVIPTPKSVEFQEGSFILDSKTTLYVENPSNETLFASSELITEIQQDLNFISRIVNKVGENQIVFCLLGRDTKAITFLKSKKIEIPFSPGDEEYVLKVLPTQIVISSSTEAGLFYGVQTLKQIIRANRKGNSIPGMNIIDKPALRYRGWMDDISRGPIPTVEFIKKEIRTMSEFKQNFFNLYTENVFRSSKYPDISPIDGLTTEEIKELSDYATKYHVELMGNFQSFGHQEKMLSNPFYASLAENNSILSPAVEETYNFLADIYSEMIPAYKSNFFNINCDETFGLGEGKSKAMTDSLGESGVYAYHINRLDKLIKPYNKRIMMWGDIAVNNKDIIKKLPKDLIILSWGYHAAESFDDAIAPFVDSGFEFMVAPGVGCWGELWPAMSNAVINIANYTRDGAKNGAIGMMNTAWDDNGHNLFEYNWHGLVWGAECAWNPTSPLLGEAANAERESKLKKFNSDFDALFFQTQGLTNLYQQIDNLRFSKVKGLLSESGFWEDILSFFPSNTNAEYILANQEVANHINQLLLELKSLQKHAIRNIENIEYAEFALNRALFATHKNIVRAELFQATQNQEEKEISKVQNEMKTLVNELHAIKITYSKLWEKENRNFWLDKNMGDYNKMASRILNANKQVYIEPADEIKEGIRMVSMRTLFNDQIIIYTTDGTDPTATSRVYTTPIPIHTNTVIKASVLEMGQPFGIAQKLIFLHKGIGNLKKLNSKFSAYNPVYAAGGQNALLDGIKGSNNFADGRWQGFQGQNLDIEIDFKKTIDVHSIRMDCMQNTYSWIVLPKSVEIYSSMDGINYSLCKTILHSIPMDAKGQFTHTFQATFDTLNTRYLKIIAISTGLLPSWHHASGGESFFFADEIEID